jgi:hypothetical protein
MSTIPRARVDKLEQNKIAARLVCAATPPDCSVSAHNRKSAQLAGYVPRLAIFRRVGPAGGIAMNTLTRLIFVGACSALALGAATGPPPLMALEGAPAPVYQLMRSPLVRAYKPCASGACANEPMDSVCGGFEPTGKGRFELRVYPDISESTVRTRALVYGLQSSCHRHLLCPVLKLRVTTDSGTSADVDWPPTRDFLTERDCCEVSDFGRCYSSALASEGSPMPSGTIQILGCGLRRESGICSGGTKDGEVCRPFGICSGSTRRCLQDSDCPRRRTCKPECPGGTCVGTPPELTLACGVLVP